MSPVGGGGGGSGSVRAGTLREQHPQPRGAPTPWFRPPQAGRQAGSDRPSPEMPRPGHDWGSPPGGERWYLPRRRLKCLFQERKALRCQQQGHRPRQPRENWPEGAWLRGHFLHARLRRQGISLSQVQSFLSVL